MTARNSANGHPAARKSSVFFDRLDGIRRTGRIITTRGRQQWRYPQLIASDEEHQNRLHSCAPALRSCPAIVSNSVISSSKLASYAEGNDLTTMSSGCRTGSSRVRTISRSLRRRRFRSTIVWPCFPTITAARACESRESLARTSRWSVRSRLPAFFACSRSSSRVSRLLRG